MSNFDLNALFRVKCHKLCPRALTQIKLPGVFFVGKMLEITSEDKLNAATLHVYVYISSQCPNFDRQLWASVPTAARVTHCRPECIFIQTQQLTATEFAASPPSPSSLFTQIISLANCFSHHSSLCLGLPIPGDTISPWEYIMGANMIVSSSSSRRHTFFFSNFKNSYLTFCWGRVGAGGWLNLFHSLVVTPA